MKVFAVALQKGGVGKTALTTNVAAILADRGHRVLVIDADPQGHQVLYFGLPVRGKPSLYDVLVDEAPILSTARHARERLDLVEGGAELSAAEVHLATMADGTHRLRAALQLVSDKYDYVLIDTPPNLGRLTTNALVCASRLLVPVQTEQAAANSLVNFFKTCAAVRKHFNPTLLDPWLVPSMFQANTVHQREILDHLKNNPHGYEVLSPIRRTVKITDSFSMGKPIYELDRSASDGFERVAERIEANGQENS